MGIRRVFLDLKSYDREKKYFNINEKFASNKENCKYFELATWRGIEVERGIMY